MNQNKTILIIGAKSDIAIEAARKFAAEGYNLQLAARNASELVGFANDLRIRHQIEVFTHELDILKYESFNDFLESLAKLPDISLCAVGILGNQKEDENNILASKLVVETNYVGPSLMLGEIANRFKKRGFGSIIGISSVAGVRGRASNYIYGSSKSGFTNFLSGLRNRLNKTNINVLTISPGFVKTKMTENLHLPKLLTASPKYIASQIFKNRNKDKAIIILPWNLIMLIIRLLPEVIFKKLNI